MAHIDKVIIPVYRCPSSPVAEFVTYSAPQTRMIPSYVGISGSDLAGYTQTSAVGRVGGDGTLFPNSRVRFDTITDGTSNLIVVGEQSNFLRDDACTKYSDKSASSGGYGWTMGSHNDSGRTPPTWMSTGVSATAYNWVTVTSYQINQPATYAGANLSVTVGSATETGNNHPFRSAHPGGASFLFGDGSVRMLTNELPLTTLKQLASRNDGAVVTLP